MPSLALSGAKGRGDLFFASPGRRQKVSCHGEIAKRHQVPIDGSEVSCHDEIVSVRAENKAPARRPTAPMMLSRETKLSGCHRI